MVTQPLVTGVIGWTRSEGSVRPGSSSELSKARGREARVTAPLPLSSGLHWALPGAAQGLVSCLCTGCELLVLLTPRTGHGHALCALPQGPKRRMLQPY